MGKAKAKTIFSMITGIISWIFGIVAAILLLAALISTFSDGRGVFGYSFYTVVTGSMEPEIKVGDLIVAQQVDKAEIQIDDDIVFYNEVEDKTIVHRVIGEDSNGDFITKGIANDSPDKQHVSNPLGRVVAVSTFAGWLVTALTKMKTPLFIAFAVLLLAFAVMEIVNIARTSAQIKKDRQKSSEDGNGEDLSQDLSKHLAEPIAQDDDENVL